MDSSIFFVFFLDSMRFPVNFEGILRDLKDFPSFLKRFFEIFRISDEFSVDYTYSRLGLSHVQTWVPVVVCSHPTNQCRIVGCCLTASVRCFSAAGKCR